MESRQEFRQRVVREGRADDVDRFTQMFLVGRSPDDVHAILCRAFAPLARGEKWSFPNLSVFAKPSAGTTDVPRETEMPDLAIGVQEEVPTPGPEPSPVEEADLGEVSSTPIAQAPVTRTENMSEAVAWVYDHLEVADYDRVIPPSAGAAAMLKWARGGPRERSLFYTTFVPTVLRYAQAKLESEIRFHDDGRNVTDLLDELDRAFGVALLPEGSEDAGQECRIPSASRRIVT